MKTRIMLVVLLSTFVWASWTVAFEPSVIRVHPQLAEHQAAFFPPEVIQVTDGVYVARGFNRDNPVLIVGGNGLIVIDPGESIPAAETVRAAFNERLDGIFDKKPVKAIIYTHHHDCHINGASVFAGDKTEIIAHESLMTNLFNEWWGPVFPSRAEGGVKMSGGFFQDDPGWYAGGILFGVQHLGPSGFLAPTKTVKEEWKTNIAGVNLTLIPAPGETRDILVVWLQDKKVLIEIGIIYEAFPALATMRGSGQRDPLDYLKSLKLCRNLEAEYLVALHGPRPVTAGKENVREFLTNFSDAIQFVHDQTLQYMNKGLAPGEIKDLIVLPPHLANSPYLRETYGRIDWDVFHIFRFYRGYYTGKIRDLFPKSPMSEALMAAELAGGVAALAAKAENAFFMGKLEWALELADDVLLLDSGNERAFETKASAMLALAEETMNTQAYNYLLSDYLLLTGQIIAPVGNPKILFATVSNQVVPMMPMDTLLRIMAVSLNASKSLDKDMMVNLQLTDVQGRSHYSLIVRRGVLETTPEPPKNADLKIITDSMTWKKLGLYKLTPQTALSTGALIVAGGTDMEFYEFMDLFY